MESTINQHNYPTNVTTMVVLFALLWRGIYGYAQSHMGNLFQRGRPRACWLGLVLTGTPLWSQICDHINYQLCARLLTFPIFVLSQRLIARNFPEHCSSNHGISHFNEACRINELSRGSNLGCEVLTTFAFGLLQVSLLKIVFCWCFVFSTKIIDHGGSHGDVMQVFTRWRHPVASIEAQDVLHPVMRPRSYRHICMAIQIASNLSAFFVVVESLLPTTIDK